MINPELIIKPDSYYADGEKTILDFNEIPYMDKEQYDLNIDKEYKTYIADIERTARNSIEYRTLINYLKNTEGMDVCSVYENVTSRDNPKVRIEIHHYPFTLFDIATIVVAKRRALGESLKIWLVVDEIMWLHYMGYVGLYPLSVTPHEMNHNSYFFIPLDKVRGNWRAFENMYHTWISPEILDMLESAERLTKNPDPTHMNIFNQHSIYINVNGSYALPEMDVVKQRITERITEIKTGYKVMARIVK